MIRKHYMLLGHKITDKNELQHLSQQLKKQTPVQS